MVTRGEERRDGDARFVPVDGGGGLEHEAADQDERRRVGEGRNDADQRRDEDGDEEEQAGGRWR